MRGGRRLPGGERPTRQLRASPPGPGAAAAAGKEGGRQAGRQAGALGGSGVRKAAFLPVAPPSWTQRRRGLGARHLCSKGPCKSSGPLAGPRLTGMSELLASRGTQLSLLVPRGEVSQGPAGETGHPGPLLGLPPARPGSPPRVAPAASASPGRGRSSGKDSTRSSRRQSRRQLPFIGTGPPSDADAEDGLPVATGTASAPRSWRLTGKPSPRKTSSRRTLDLEEGSMKSVEGEPREGGSRRTRQAGEGGRLRSGRTETETETGEGENSSLQEGRPATSDRWWLVASCNVESWESLPEGRMETSGGASRTHPFPLESVPTDY